MNQLVAILLGVAVIIASLVNIMQSYSIDELQEQVASLQEGSCQQGAKPSETNPPATTTKPTTTHDLLQAIAYVESGSTIDTDVLGDNGRSLGPLQISKAYWIDANMPDGDYHDCQSYKYACRVALRYWARYCPQALRGGDWQTMARIHNGGPRGATKASTMTYWVNVKKEMER